MPQYEAGGGQPPSEIRPNETGVLATAQAGYRIGRAFDQEGSDIGRSVTSSGEAFQQHVASQEMVRLMPHLAELRAQHDMAWNTIISQPGFNPADPTARNKYMQQVQSDYQGLMDTTTTKASREFLQNNMYRDIEAANTKTIGDTASLVASQTLTSVRDSEDRGLQNVTADPSQLDREIGASNANTEAMIQQYGPQMGAKGIVELEQRRDAQNGRLTYQSYFSALNNAPDAASVDAIVAKLQSDKLHAGFMDESQTKELINQGHTRKEDIARDVDRQDAEQQKKDKADYDQAKVTVEGSLFHQNPDGTFVIAASPNFASELGKLRGMPGAKYDADGIESLQNAAVKASKDQADGTDNKTDASTYNWFVKNTGNFSKTDVDNAFNAGKLNREQWTTFRDMAKDGNGADSELNKAYTYLNSYLDKYSRVFGAAASADDPNAPPAGDPDAELRYGAFTAAARKLLASVIANNPGKDWHPIVNEMFDMGDNRSFIHGISTFQHGPIDKVAQGWDQGIANPSTASVQPTVVAPPAAGQSRADYIAHLAAGN